MTEQSSILRPQLHDLAPYNAGLTLDEVARRAGTTRVAKLASNENPHGCSDPVRAAMAEAISRPHLYPDPGGRALAQAVAETTGAPADRVLLGDGSEDLLNVLARAVLREGDEVVTLYPSFPLHEDYARMMGASVTRIDLADGRIDVEALCAAAARPVRLTVIANPMNPTGLWLEPAHLRALLDAQHEDSVLCLDEAYTEYARGDDYQSAIELLSEHRKPLLILRTFSKAHGLAGLRIGYGVANDAELKRGMDLVRTPFNANAVGQAAATASLHAPESVDRAVVETLRERDRMGHALTSMGLRVLPSKGNFLFVDTGRPSTDVAAALLDRAVIVKPWKQLGYETWLRISVGLDWENTLALDALADILGR